jgi:hypothetical protein
MESGDWTYSGYAGSGTARLTAWGAGLHDPIVWSVSYFGLRLSVARPWGENSWARGQNWYRTSTTSPKSIRTAVLFRDAEVLKI